MTHSLIKNLTELFCMIKLCFLKLQVPSRTWLYQATLWSPHCYGLKDCTGCPQWLGNILRLGEQEAERNGSGINPCCALIEEAHGKMLWPEQLLAES